MVAEPIPSTVRDSTYVLDGVLDNETELPIAEHTTDTLVTPIWFSASSICWAYSSLHACAIWRIKPSIVSTRVFDISISVRSATSTGRGSRSCLPSSPQSTAQPPVR